MKKAAMFTAAVTTLGVAGIVGTASVNAESGTGDTLVDKLATRFNLNRDEVKQVFDESHEERRANMDEKRSDRLQELVDQGTISSDQKSAIEAKWDEIHESMQKLRSQDITKEEAREQMKALHEEFEAWAEEQGIDLSAIRPEHGGPGRGRHHGHGGFSGDTSGSEES